MLALTLVTGAIAIQLLSMRYEGLAKMAMARSAQALSDERNAQSGTCPALAMADANKPERLERISFRYARLAKQWGIVSLGLALVAALYWPLACLHREAGAQTGLGALLVVYVLLLLL